MKISGHSSGPSSGVDPQLLAEQRLKSDTPGASEKIGPATAGPLQPERDAEIEQRTLDLIGQTGQTALAGGEIRTAKVEALKLAIAEGRYAVSDQQIADAMLRDFAR